jgi:hypothetical protein
MTFGGLFEEDRRRAFEGFERLGRGHVASVTLRLDEPVGLS